MIIWSPKDPAAVEKYGFDFTDALNGDSIASQSFTGDGVTLAGAAIAGKMVRFTLSGGTAGTVAKVSGSIVSSSGETLPALGVLEIGGEVISLADAKAAQKIEDDTEDAILAAFLRAAIGLVERASGKNLVPRIVTQVFDAFSAPSARGLVCGRADGALKLHSGPVSEILSVAYDGSDGVEQNLSSFRLVEGSRAAPARLLPAFGESWPATAWQAGAVRVTYVAGYDATELPPDLTQAAILLFGHWNAHREAVIASDRAAAIELPLGVEALIAPYRIPGIA